MAKKTPKPGRTLLVFAIAVALLYGAAALGKTWKPQLGLDLEGGTRITMQASGNPGQTRMNLARAIIEQRANGSGVTESSTKIQGGNTIVVEVPGKNAKNIVETVQRTAQLRFRLVAATAAGTPQPTSSPSPSGSASPTGSPTGKASSGSSAGPGQSSTKGANNRPAPFEKKPKPTKSASTSAVPSPLAGNGSLKVGTSLKDALAFQASPPTAWQAKFATYTCPKKGEALPEDDPDKPLITCDDKGNKFLLSTSVIEGTSLKSASYGNPQNSTAWAVNLQLKGAAVDDFAEISKKLLANNGQFATVLDGKVISYAGFNGVIPNGDAQITGGFTQASARSLSNSLRFGALPVHFKQPNVETIGPTLAGDQLRAGILAGIIGLAVVMIYCLLYYRGLGLVVLASLVVAAVITYAVVLVLAKTAGFTLTLPGIAGLIVAVGITADSFIVYFERIRDEMRTGKSMRVAVELGWARARNTCLAADGVSFLAAIVLYIFTIGVVKGFAFALGISTLIDLAVFFWFTKPVMTVLARREFFSSGHKYSGLSAETLGIDEGHHGMRHAPAAATTAGRSA